MSSFTFNSRESYVVYSTAWKEAYRQLTLLQRQQKVALKKAFRDNAYTEAARLQYAILRTKSQACAAIEERHASKVEASRQYREQAAVAV